MDREHFEDLVMAAGYRSCFGCRHYEDGRKCKGCNVTNSHWEPNERWKQAQEKGRKKE